MLLIVQLFKDWYYFFTVEDCMQKTSFPLWTSRETKVQNNLKQGFWWGQRGVKWPSLGWRPEGIRTQPPSLLLAAAHLWHGSAKAPSTRAHAAYGTAWTELPSAEAPAANCNIVQGQPPAAECHWYPSSTGQVQRLCGSQPPIQDIYLRIYQKSIFRTWNKTAVNRLPVLHSNHWTNSPQKWRLFH